MLSKLADGEIVAQVSGEADESDSGSESAIDTKTTVSHAKAHEALGIALEWLEAEGMDAAHLLLIKSGWALPLESINRT